MMTFVSPKLIEVVDAAARVAMLRQSFYVGIEHLVETIVERMPELPAEFVERRGVLLKQAFEAIRSKPWEGTDTVPGSETYYTPRFISTANKAELLSKQLRTESADSAHMLFALLMDEDSALSRVLVKGRYDREELARELLEGIVPKKRKSSFARRTNKAEDQTAEINVNDFVSDLTAAAKAGALTPAIGRDAEIRTLAQSLSRKEKNNVILVGEPGVGKTKIVEGMAVGLANGTLTDLVPFRRLLELNLAALLSGTAYRGSFESKILKLLEELEEDPEVLLFIDEIHLIMGSGTTEGQSADLGNLIKPALSRGKLRCIGATTLSEYRKFIVKDPAMERRFHRLQVEGLSGQETYNLLKTLQAGFEKHHGVPIGRNTITAAVKLSERYLTNRHQPDKAIEVLDQACARFRLKRVLAETDPEALENTVHPNESMTVTPHDVHKVVSEMTGLPVHELTDKDRVDLVDLEESLSRRIIGQREAIARIVKPIKKWRAGLSDPNRPGAVMMFVGPTGVGKTQTAKSLAQFVFGSHKALKTFDMSEYVEEHSVSRLLGAPPGYVGSDEDGELAAAMLGSPHALLLFDEIEKAHPRIFDMLLPLMDEGRIEDSKGRELNFKNSIVLFTSNAAYADTDASPANGVTARHSLEPHFRPEFLNRIDEIVVFRPLDRASATVIARQLLDEVCARLKQQGIELTASREIYRYLAKKGFDPKYGARGMKRIIERKITGPITDKILEQKFRNGDKIELFRDGSSLICRRMRSKSGSKKNAVADQQVS